MNRDDITSQMPGLKKQFNAYKDFAAAGFGQVFSPEQLKDAYTLEANTILHLVIYRTMATANLPCIPLPPLAQMAPLNGMQVGDFNGDGNLDVA